MSSLRQDLESTPRVKPFRARIHITSYLENRLRRWRVGAEGATADHLSLKGSGVHYGDDSLELATYMRKPDAIKAAVAFQHTWWHFGDTPSSLYIHNTQGEIRDERTYPRKSDPRETKG